MRRVLAVALLVMPSIAVLTAGCEREIEKEKTVETKPNGETITQEKKVTESPNGTVTQTEKKSVDKPQP